MATIPTHAIMWLLARKFRACSSLHVEMFFSYVFGIWQGFSGGILTTVQSKLLSINRILPLRYPSFPAALDGNLLNYSFA